MTERRVAAALLIGATAAAITTAIAAHSVLRSSSGTHFALMVFLPLLVAPGLLAWLSPRTRTFALWATFGGGASIVWAIAGSPYSYERALPGWRAVHVSAWVTIGIVVAGGMCAAFWFAARASSPEELATPLARRLRRIIQLVLPIAAVISVVGLLPGERLYFDHTFLHERAAGGGWLILALALALAPAAVVYRDPRRRWVWMWVVWTVPTGLLVAAASFDLSIFATPVPMWPTHVVRFGIGMILVLLLLVMPLVALASRGADEAGPDTTLPEARLRP